MAASDTPVQPKNDGADRDPLVDTTVEKYRIVRRIGRGGMGAVYEALNTLIQKRVALKFIDPLLAKRPRSVARFQREALAASAIESPYIVQLFDAGTTDEGAPYLVMELLRGCDLRQHLQAVGRLELGPTLHIAAQILKALQHAHAAGIVHRDLKPDNVFLVDRRDEPVGVKLLDFGISKISAKSNSHLETLTREGAVVGTPCYMSPEQAEGKMDIDHRSDVYSAGAILYECLCGQPPHKARTYEQMILVVCTRDAKDIRELEPSVPAEIASVLANALRRDRERRYPSADMFLASLAAAAPPSMRDRYFPATTSRDDRALAVASQRVLTPDNDPTETVSTSRPPAVAPDERPPESESSSTRAAIDGLAETMPARLERTAPPSTLTPAERPGRTRRTWSQAGGRFLPLAAVVVIAALITVFVFSELSQRVKPVAETSTAVTTDSLASQADQTATGESSDITPEPNTHLAPTGPSASTTPSATTASTTTTLPRTSTTVRTVHHPPTQGRRTRPRTSASSPAPALSIWK